MSSSRILVRVAAAILLATWPVLSGQVVSVSASSNYPLWDSNDQCRPVVPQTGEWTCNAGGALSSDLYAGYTWEAVTFSISRLGSQDVPPLTVSVYDRARPDLAQSSTFDAGIPGQTTFHMGPLATGSSPSDLFLQVNVSATGPFLVGVSTAPDAAPANTATPNPSDTSTPTIAPGTVPPSNTPRATVGVQTFTPTSVPTSVPTSTPGPTSIPAPLAVDCGPPAFPLLNCNMAPYGVSSASIPPPGWDVNKVSGIDLFTGAAGRAAGQIEGAYNGGDVSGSIPVDPSAFRLVLVTDSSGDGRIEAVQNVVAATAGTVDVGVSHCEFYSNSGATFRSTSCAGVFAVQIDSDAPVNLLASGDISVGHVSAGAHVFHLQAYSLGSFSLQNDYYQAELDVGFTTDVPWTPGPSSTPTPGPSSTPTATSLPTETPIAAPCDPAIFGTVGCGGASAAGGCDFFDLLCWIQPRCLSCDVSPVAAAVETEVPVGPSAVRGLGSMVTSSQVCSDIGGSGPIFVNPHGGSTVATLHFKPCGLAGFSSFWPGVRVLALVISYVLFTFWILRFVQRVFGRRHLTP